MAKNGRFPIAVVLVLTSFVPAWGHYLWVRVDGGSQGKAVVNLYFEESARPGDGKYLDPFIQRGKTWVVSGKEPKPLRLQETRKGKLRWLSAVTDVTPPLCVESYGKFGVYRYGKTDVLLHYYTRYLDARSPEELQRLSRSTNLALQIVPAVEGGKVVLTVLWRGKPVVNRIVYVRGPKRFRQNLKTDENGKVRFAPVSPGEYHLRTYVQENKAGKDGGRAYALIRHHATMIVKLPVSR